MKKILLFMAACAMSLLVVSCGYASKDKARIAELEAQIASAKLSTQDIVGTYEFSDNTNTWILVVEADEDADYEGTCYIYNKSIGDKVKYYGSWHKFRHMKFAALEFAEKAPIVNFPSEELTSYSYLNTLRYPRINTEWIYADSHASEAKNPNLRLALKKIQ